LNENYVENVNYTDDLSSTQQRQLGGLRHPTEQEHLLNSDEGMMNDYHPENGIFEELREDGEEIGAVNVALNTGHFLKRE
jgi:hypothetical protein